MKYFGLSKAEVARKANIARSTFYRYLSGEILVSENAAFRLSKVFHSDEDVFSKQTFQIVIENPESNTINMKLCQWKEQDDCFQILNEIEDSQEKYPDYVKSINEPYVHKLSPFPISNSEKDSDNDISEYTP